MRGDLPPVSRRELRMWSDALAMLDRADRLRQLFFVPGRGSASEHAWEPPVDLFETENEVCVIVALPGVGGADLDVDIDAELLIVRGRRALPSGLRHARLHRLELPHGRFERRVRLPSPHLRVTDSRLVDGCLTLTLEKGR